MSGITFISRDYGVNVSIVRLTTTDSIATATASNYITAQDANIIAANNGEFTWQTNDCILLSASDGLAFCSINSTFTTLALLAVNASQVVVKNAVNTMAAGGEIVFDKGTATTTGGAATINKQAGILTTEALTTAAGSTYVITLTNSEIASTSLLLLSAMGGTNTVENWHVKGVVGSGSATITITNTDPSAALNGTIKLGFLVG